MDWGSPSSPNIKHPPGNHRSVIGDKKTSIWIYLEPSNGCVSIFSRGMRLIPFLRTPRIAPATPTSASSLEGPNLFNVRLKSLAIPLGCLKNSSPREPQVLPEKSYDTKSGGIPCRWRNGPSMWSLSESSKPCDPDHVGYVGSWKASNASCRGKC